MSDQSDFNLWVATHFWHKATNIACRFFDQNVTNWAELSCVWHERFSYGAKAPKDDEYVWEGKQIRRKSVDELIQKNEPMNSMAQVMFDSWRFYKKSLDDRRIEPPPPIIIAPPEPEPVPLPVPVEPKPSPDVPKQKPTWLIKAGVWLTISTPIVLLGTSFLPPPFNILAKVIFELLKQLAN